MPALVAVLTCGAVTLRYVASLQEDTSSSHSHRSAASSAVASVGQSSGPTINRRWLAVLNAIDRRRAEAWRRGDPTLLARVYVAGSPGLAEDRRMLAGYLGRGLTVSGVDMRFLSVEVSSRRPAGVSLKVVDRLGAAVAHDEEGHSEALPRDLPTRHRIELRRVADKWRIASIVVA